jgi:maleate isomerase
LNLPFETDHGFGSRAVLGLIVLQEDETVENEFRQFAGFDGISLYHSRIQSDPDVTAETLARMEAEIPSSVGLLPAAVRFDAIGYACTSGATIIGEENVAAAIRTVKPEAAATNPLTAAKAAFQALDVMKIGFVTPYIEEVSAAMRRNFEASGLQINAFGSFEQSEEHTVAQITNVSVLNAILEIGSAEDCDAVFVSCTNLRTAGVIEDAEAKLGKPVVSSNQALAWHLLRLAGISDQPSGLGLLYQRPMV